MNKTNKITKEERLRRIEKIQSEAAQAVRKSEQLNFRLEPDLISQLGDLAIKKRIPLGTMIRNWVIERLEEESTQKTQALGYVRESASTYATAGLLEKRVQILETEVKRQKKYIIRTTKNFETALASKTSALAPNAYFDTPAVLEICRQLVE